MTLYVFMKYNTDFEDYDLYSYFYGLVSQIPPGRISTYGALARALGDPVSARACGYMLSINEHPDIIPCYRVVKSTGEVWKYTHPLGPVEKIRRLSNDGIPIKNGMVEGLDRYIFDSFDTDFPLRGMKDEQIRVSRKIRLDDDFNMGTIGAIDVSYDDFNGYAALVVQSNGEIHVKTLVLPVRFPYIPGYLAYREFRFIHKLCSEFEGILLVDASGYLHPRKIGLASFAGILLDIPTIGISKSILTGQVSGNWIFNLGEKAGYIINNRTIVSPGHRISLNSAIRVVKEIGNGDYPEILKIAHNNTVELRKRYVSTLRDISV